MSVIVEDLLLQFIHQLLSNQFIGGMRIKGITEAEHTFGVRQKLGLQEGEDIIEILG